MVFKHQSERGQALIIITFAIIGLVGITGLAIDGGMAFSDRRHAQNAADTAALAGALAKINAQETVSELEARVPMRVAALDRAESNGYENNLVSNTVEVYTCDETGLGASCAAPYAGDSDYIQVIITSHVDTWFARVIGIPQVHNRVQAIALADDDDTGPLFDGAGIITVNPDCPSQGSMIVTGNADINILGGGLFSNADEECSFKCSTSAGSLYVEGGITTAGGGGYTWGGHCEENMTGDTDDTGDQIPYFAGIPVLPEPDECDPLYLPTATYGTWNDPYDSPDIGIDEVTFLTPGYYGTFPPKKDSAGNNLENTIVMAPGVYCVNSVVKLVDQNLKLWGENITIYIREGSGFNINGGVMDLRATQAGTYAGYLIIVAPDWDGAVTSCTLEGNALNHYEGAIFAPHCDVTINGTSDTPPNGIDSQIIAYNVTINGGAVLNINYDADKNPYVADPPKTGVVK